MSNISVGSFNTSFASDLGFKIGSESNWLTTCNNRECFKNSIETVCKFLREKEYPVIGLQEVNDTNFIDNHKTKLSGNNLTSIYFKSKFGKPMRRGSGGKMYELSDVKENTKGSDYIYKQIHDDTCEKDIVAIVGGVLDASEKNLPSLMIAYDKTKFGEPKYYEIYDLEQDPGFYKNDEIMKVDGFPQKGRPILFVYTEEGYLFITLHSANKGEIFASSDVLKKELNKKINEHFTTFSRDKIINNDPQKTFFMGDFNDPYRTIESIQFNGNNYKYIGEPPLSCCYNVNSSCKGRPENTDDVKITLKDGTEKILKRISGRNECTTIDRPSGSNINRTGPPSFHNSNTGKPEKIGDEGNLENYKFYGDYVFGFNPKTPILFYKPQNQDSVSIRSDHEMVYATFPIPSVAGGGKKTRRKRRSHKRPHSHKRPRSHKRHRTRKHKTQRRRRRKRH